MSINRLRSPRVTECLAVDIINIKGEHLQAMTLDISCDGFGIRCSIADRNQITPQGDFVKGGKPVEVNANVKLPSQHGHSDCINTRCRVVYSRRIAQGICQIGMTFKEMEDDGQDKLVKFIQNVVNL